MPPAIAAKPAARKRNRKRKRRAASESSSSESLSSSESDDESPPKIVKIVPVEPTIAHESSSESSSESSDSDSEPDVALKPTPATVRSIEKAAVPLKPRHRASPSPSPPPAELPSFLPSGDSTQNDAVKHEHAMRAKFRRFWMSSVADGFKDDLEEIRKETNLGTSRLTLLIDSLASGADIFTSSTGPSKSNDINEVDVILN